MTTLSNHQLKQKRRALRKKDELARGAMFSIAKHKQLPDRIVLQGGNALHFIYSSPRYSHDLDFVLRDRETSMTKTVEMVCDVLSKEYNIEKANGNGTAARTVERVKYWFKDSDIRGVIEIADQISLDPVKTSGTFFPLMVETPSEIYADKIIATLGRMEDRGSLKGSDLFDILYIKDMLKVGATGGELARKAETYQFTGWKRETLEKTVDYILSEDNFPKMEKDIRKSLMPDVSEIYRVGKEFFQKASQCFVRLYAVI